MKQKIKIIQTIIFIYTISFPFSANAMTVEEIIKPFRLSDNELYKSPVNLANYIQANANEFGAFILGKVKSAVESGTTASATKAGAQMDLTTIRSLVKELDSYVEDTPHLLRIIESENQKGPQTSTKHYMSDKNVLKTKDPFF